MPFQPGLQRALTDLVGPGFTFQAVVLGRLPLALAHVPNGVPADAAKIGDVRFGGAIVIVADRPSRLGDGERFDGLNDQECRAVIRRLKVPAFRFCWINPAQLGKDRSIAPIDPLAWSSRH